MSAEDRFGVVAVESDIITPEQLFDALKTQVTEELEGTESHLIGEKIKKKGYMTMPQIAEVLV